MNVNMWKTQHAKSPKDYCSINVKIFFILLREFIFMLMLQRIFMGVYDQLTDSVSSLQQLKENHTC